MIRPGNSQGATHIKELTDGYTAFTDDRPAE